MAEVDLDSPVDLADPLPVDVSDRCARLLGQLCVAGSPIDPRAIRALTFLTDSVNVTGSSVDVTDRCTRLLGQLCSAQGGAIDPRDRNWLLTCTDQIDVCDRAARLVGIVYGNLAQLQQRPVSFELLTDPVDRCTRLLGQLCAPQGGAIDPRDRNWDLNFATDQVDVSGSTVTTASGSVTTMDDAFMELRLMADALKDLPLTIDASTSRVRVSIEAGNITNLLQIGGINANTVVLDEMDIVWNTGIRTNCIV